MRPDCATASRSMYAYYVDAQAGFGTYPRNAQKPAEDAVAAADPLVDFSQFDNDGPDGIPDSGDDDGVVDALFVVHAEPGRETTGSDNDIHSQAWSMANPLTVDGVTAGGYSMEPEDGQRGVFGHVSAMSSACRTSMTPITPPTASATGA